MRTRASPLAYVPGSLAVAGSLALAIAFPEQSGGLGFVLSTPATNAWPFLVLGLIAYHAFPANRVAQLLLLVGTLQSARWTLAASSWTFDDLGTGPVPVAALFLAYDVVGSAALASVATFAGLLPDGRVERRYEWWVLVAAWATVLIPFLHLLASPVVPIPWWFEVGHPAASPLWVPALSGLDGVLVTVKDAPVVLAAASLLLALRYRRSDAERRRVLRGLLIASIVVFVTDAMRWTLESFGVAQLGVTPWLTWVTVLAFVYIFGSVFVALFKKRLLGAEIAFRKSVIYGFLWACIGGAAIGTAALVGIVMGRRLSTTMTVLVTILVTLALQPARRRLERLADRWVYGKRWSRYEVVTRFGEVLKETFDVAQLAPRLAETVREGLDLEWARVSLSLRTEDAERAEPVGAAGIELDEDATPALTFPLIHEGERVATIECGPKRDGELTPEDHELLENLGRQAALAIRNSKLAAELAARLEEIRRQAGELAASRSRLVTAQDAERRRIERNIHDGVQQQIVALVAKLRLARNQLARDPELSDETLDQLQAEAVQTLKDLRELAHGIHPPVLTDRGLPAAVDAAAGRMPFPVEVDVDSALADRRFEEPTEVAAYYVVSEALANVLKHADATRVWIRLARQGDGLVVKVRDDGRGFVRADVSGSGLRNLRDRVEAVGGSFHVRSRPGEGTELEARFPVRVEEARPV